MKTRSLPCVVLVLSIALLPAAADDALKADPAKIAELIKQLGSNDAAQREAATKMLDALGEAALEPLKEASILDKNEQVQAAAGGLFAKIHKRWLPAALSPKEIEEGWISLFDGQTTYGWKTPEGSGMWSVKESELVAPADKPGLLVTTTQFGACELRFQCYITGTKKDGKYVQPIGTVIRVGADATGKPVDGRSWHIDIPTASSQKDLEEVDKAFPLADFLDQWVEVTVTADWEKGKVVYGARYKGLESNKPMMAAGKPGHEAIVGSIALAGQNVRFRNIKLRPLGMKSIFNGKDLSGWKVFQANPNQAKSKFGVSKEGYLEIKSGPGDIQTEGAWDDFILQLDCRTNGKYLNSGVFFRCLPDLYQQGYEAQIRNQCADGNRSKPVDFGTGAIYRRQPARRVVGFDRDWFTMTLIARGRHLAVWVNGYQTTDFNDDRPAGKNARQNACLEKGPISLQGHDPTTDLSFRNFRVVELKK